MGQPFINLNTFHNTGSGKKFLDGKKENICIPVGCKYWKRYKQVTRLCNTHEDIILCQEDLPYKSIITDIDAFHTIWAYLDKYTYSHIKYTMNGTFYASGYTNREEVSDSVDHLNIKIFSRDSSSVRLLALPSLSLTIMCTETATDEINNKARKFDETILIGQSK